MRDNERDEWEIVSVRIERAQLARVREVARATERSANQVIRLAVRTWLKDRT